METTRFQLRAFTPELVRSIVASHELWLDTKGAEGERADLRKARLREYDFSGDRLSGALFKGADLFRVRFGGCELIEADLRETYLCKADLRDANLSRARLEEANLRGAYMMRTNLAGASLERTNATEAHFLRASLRNTRGEYADFTDAMLVEADLTQADLSYANFDNAKLKGASLQSSQLTEASLKNADLRSAVLTGAVLDGTSLTGAKLCNARRERWSIKGARCAYAFWDQDAKEQTRYSGDEFETSFSEKPSIKLSFPGGLGSFKMAMLPLLLERLRADDDTLHLSIQATYPHEGCSIFHIGVHDTARRDAQTLQRDTQRAEERILSMLDAIGQNMGTVKNDLAGLFNNWSSFLR